MILNIDNAAIYVATGGKDFAPSLNTVVFLHGSGLDHRSWALQTRWFAFHGYSVLAPDFPGHSLSGGTALASIEAMAAWVWQLCDAAGAQKVILVGHSQGALVAMEAAALAPQRVAAVSIIASAASIPVNPQLLQLAGNAKHQAIDAMLQWGFGSDYRFGLSDVPGQCPMGIGSRIMAANPLAEDLKACQDYQGGEAAAAKITAPSQLILARDDKMTPYRSGVALKNTLGNCSRLDSVDAGHMLPIEAPQPTLSYLRQFVEGALN